MNETIYYPKIFSAQNAEDLQHRMDVWFKEIQQERSLYIDFLKFISDDHHFYSLIIYFTEKKDGMTCPDQLCASCQRSLPLSSFPIIHDGENTLNIATVCRDCWSEEYDDDKEYEDEQDYGE